MIELYTAGTPNGWKASIALEEMGIAYHVTPISLMDQDQKQDWFLEINPNGRIPAIVDKDNNDFAIFESGAILLYLAEKSGKLLPQDINGRSEVIQWLMFQMGGIGPMMGQANVFYRYAEEKIPYAITRYQNESRRLFEVLDKRLADRAYLAGDYSIADIANWSWVTIHEWSGVSIEGLPHLKKWIDTIAERPAVKVGIEIPYKEEKKEDAKEEDIVKTARSILA